MSQQREEKIVAHLCQIAEEPSENQTKFLEHIVHRLASPSSKIRAHAAALLNKTLKHGKMETTDSTSLDLGDFLFRLDVLKNSVKARGRHFWVSFSSQLET